jgi:hypothetical protein
LLPTLPDVAVLKKPQQDYKKAEKEDLALFHGERDKVMDWLRLFHHKFRNYPVGQTPKNLTAGWSVTPGFLLFPFLVPSQPVSLGASTATATIIV